MIVNLIVVWSPVGTASAIVWVSFDDFWQIWVTFVAWGATLTMKTEWLIANISAVWPPLEQKVHFFVTYYFNILAGLGWATFVPGGVSL